jgi:hypothetical protein
VLPACRQAPNRAGLGQAGEFGIYFLRILQERTKETVRATSIPDIEKRKKRRISLSFIIAYLFSIIPT